MKRSFISFALRCGIAAAIGVGIPAHAERFSQEVASTRPVQQDGKYQLCGPNQCEYVSLPAGLGLIDGVQSWPIAKASRASGLVTGRLGYAVCAVPLWGGPVQCANINMPRLPEVAYVLTQGHRQDYTIATLARSALRDPSTFRPLSGAFLREFRAALAQLNQLIEYRRPPTRSANRLQISADGVSAMAMSETECPKDGDGTAQCPPVEVGGSSSWGSGGFGGGATGGGEGMQCPSGILMPEPCYSENTGGGSVDVGFIEWESEYRDRPACKEEEIVMRDIQSQLNSPEVQSKHYPPPGQIIMFNRELLDPRFAGSKGADPGWVKYEVKVIIRHIREGTNVVDMRRIDMHYMFNRDTKQWTQLKFKTTAGSGCPKMGA